MLAALPRRDRNMLLTGAEQVDLEFRKSLYRRNDPVRHVYFPLSGMISLVMSMSDGSSVETSTVGRDGVLGIPMIFRKGKTSETDAIVQVQGEGVRIAVDDFQRCLEGSAALANLGNRYVQAQFEVVGVNAACNRLHSAEQRLSRWLLMTQDRLESDVFPLTHEFLGQMLGVRRASVTEAAGALAAQGLIRYRHGQISILDRAGLESCACECYEFVREAFEGLYS